MFRQPIRILMGGLPIVSSKEDPSDEIDPDMSEAALRRRLELMESEAPISGWSRVRYLFMKDPYGNFSPYVSTIVQLTAMSGLAGCVFGGFKRSQVAYSDFLRTNQATKFHSHLDAKKALQDRYTIAFAKGAFQLGWRTSLFTAMFVTVTNVTAAYRNKDGILEYTVGAAAAGMSYRISLGWRGMIVGCILGATLGTAGGIMCNILSQLTGFSMTDVRNSQYMYLANRSRLERLAFDKAQRKLEMSENAIALQKIEDDEKSGRIYDKLDNIEVHKK